MWVGSYVGRFVPSMLFIDIYFWRCVVHVDLFLLLLNFFWLFNIQWGGGGSSSENNG